MSPCRYIGPPRTTMPKSYRDPDADCGEQFCLPHHQYARLSCGGLDRFGDFSHPDPFSISHTPPPPLRSGCTNPSPTPDAFPKLIRAFSPCSLTGRASPHIVKEDGPPNKSHWLM